MNEEVLMDGEVSIYLKCRLHFTEPQNEGQMHFSVKF
jgi:hypothetical protein